MSPVMVSSVESFAMANSFGAAVAAAANSMIHNTAVSVVSFFIYYTLLFYPPHSWDTVIANYLIPLNGKII